MAQIGDTAVRAFYIEWSTRDDKGRRVVIRADKTENIVYMSGLATDLDILLWGSTVVTEVSEFLRGVE